MQYFGSPHPLLHPRKLQKKFFNFALREKFAEKDSKYFRHAAADTTHSETVCWDKQQDPQPHHTLFRSRCRQSSVKLSCVEYFPVSHISKERKEHQKNLTNIMFNQNYEHEKVFSIVYTFIPEDRRREENLYHFTFANNISNSFASSQQQHQHQHQRNRKNEEHNVSVVVYILHI